MEQLTAVQRQKQIYKEMQERKGKKTNQTHRADLPTIKLPEGKTTLRILPGKTDMDLMYLPIALHWLDMWNSEKNIIKAVPYLCPKESFTIREKCPICEQINKLFNTDVDRYKAYKKGKSSQYAYANTLIYDSEKEELGTTVKIVQLTKGQYEKLLGYFDNPQYGDLTDWETGTLVDFLIVKDKSSIPKTDVSPWRKSVPIKKETFVDKLYDLEEQIFNTHKRLTHEELTAVWNKHQASISDPSKIDQSETFFNKEDTHKDAPKVISKSPETPVKQDIADEAVQDIRAVIKPKTEATTVGKEKTGFTPLANRPEGSPECFGQTIDSEGNWVGWEITETRCSTCVYETDCEVLMQEKKAEEANNG